MRIVYGCLLLLALPAFGALAGPAPPAGGRLDTTQLTHLLKLADRALASRPDSAQFYAGQVLTLAQPAHLFRQEAQALEFLGWARFARGDYAGSLGFYQRALTAAQAAHFPRQETLLNTDIGQVLQEQGAYPEALEHYLTALRYYGRVRDSTHLAYAIQHVASVEYCEHHYAQAIAYYQQVLRLLRKNKDSGDLEISYQGLAMVYVDQRNFAQAEHYFRLGLQLFQRRHDPLNEAVACNNLGDVYCKQKKYAQANQYFTQALKLATANQDESMVAVCCAGLAQLHLAQRDYGPAETYARRSVAIAERIKAQPVAKEACFVLASALAAQRQFEPALSYYKQGKALEDSIYGSRHTAQVDALRDQYQHYRREQEEATHRYRIQELEREQRLSRLMLLLTLGIGLSLFGLGWLFWRQRRATRQRDQAQQLARQATERLEHLQNEARLRETEFELAHKNKKLTSLALDVMQKGEFLQEMKESLEVIGRTADAEVRKQLLRLRQRIEQNGPAAKEWEQFRLMFEEVHHNFFSELQRQYADVTPNELRLAALLRLNFSSKAMAGLLGISEESIKKARHRLRQKLQLSPAENLVEFMVQLEAAAQERATPGRN